MVGKKESPWDQVPHSEPFTHPLVATIHRVCGQEPSDTGMLHVYFLTQAAKQINSVAFGESILET